MKLVFTRASLVDLRSISEFTLRTSGDETEKRYLDRMWACFGEVIADPGRQRIRKGPLPGCRIAAEGKHLILYRSSPDQLEIVRVLHAAMDYKRHLPPDSQAE